MWKPDEVVPEHRWRARLVWAGLLVTILVYACWQIWRISGEMKDPSTSLEITHETYEFPYVLACFAHGAGCEYTDESIDTCVAGARENSYVYDWNGNDFHDLVVDSPFSDCVGFDLAKLNAVGSELSPDKAQATVIVQWTVTETASNQTEHCDTVTMFMSAVEPTDDDQSSQFVPFTRYLPEDETLGITAVDLTIGKTTKSDLRGDETVLFPALVMAEVHYAMTNPWYDSSSTSDDAYGILYLTVRQGEFSRIAVREINPLDVGNLLGNIGGFWELLIILWSLFFIAVREERQPKLKARDFGKTVQVGKGIVTRRMSSSVDSSTATSSSVEQKPAWEPVNRGVSLTSDASAVTAGDGFPGARPVAIDVPLRRQNSSSSSSDDVNRSGSAWNTRPVVHDAPVCGSRPLGGPPAG
ncbi:unnamed protein product [Pylaiella littoralis]